MLPQGFKNFQNISGKILAKYLKDILLKLEIFLQHVDELLIGSNTYGRLFALHHYSSESLAKGRYKVSTHKVLIYKEEMA